MRLESGECELGCTRPQLVEIYRCIESGDYRQEKHFKLSIHTPKLQVLQIRYASRAGIRDKKGAQRKRYLQ